MSFMEEMSKKTVMELRSFAKQNNMNLDGANKKLEILEVIASFYPDGEPKPVAEKTKPKEKVAIYSSRNIHWNGVGSLKVGYNLVTEEDAVKWLAHKAVREASPQEVAKHYGK